MEENNEYQKTNQRESKLLKIVIIMIIMILGLSSYIIYDKFFYNDNNKIEEINKQNNQKIQTNESIEKNDETKNEQKQSVSKYKKSVYDLRLHDLDYGEIIYDTDTEKMYYLNEKTDFNNNKIIILDENSEEIKATAIFEYYKKEEDNEYIYFISDNQKIYYGKFEDFNIKNINNNRIILKELNNKKVKSYSISQGYTFENYMGELILEGNKGIKIEYDDNTTKEYIPSIPMEVIIPEDFD